VKLLFDENLSLELVEALAIEYPGSAHVRSVGYAEPTITKYGTTPVNTGLQSYPRILTSANGAL
jgi:hypothetical protein